MGIFSVPLIRQIGGFHGWKALTKGMSKPVAAPSVRLAIRSTPSSIQSQTLPFLLTQAKPHDLQLRIPTPTTNTPSSTKGGALAARTWFTLDTFVDVLNTPLPLFTIIGLFTSYNIAFNWRNSWWDRCLYAEATTFAVYGALLISYGGTPLFYSVFIPLMIINGSKFMVMVYILLNQQRILVAPKKHKIVLKRLQN